jgi:VWFA-related protein
MRAIARSGFVICRVCRHLWLAPCLVALFAVSLFAQSFAPGEVRVSSGPYVPPQNALRVNTKEVQVEVVVRDPKGTPVGGLTENQFQLFDKGQPRKLSGFSAEVRSSPAPISGYSKPKTNAASASAASVPAPARNPRPRFVALFFDDIHTLPGDFGHAQIAAKRFVKEAMSPGDRVGVFTSSSTTTLGFTGDKDKLVETIDALKARPMVTDGSAADCPRITPFQAHQIVANDLIALQAAFWEAKQCRNDGTDVYTGDFGGSGDPIAGGGDPTNFDSLAAQKDKTVQTVRFQATAIWSRAKMISQMTFNAVQTALSRLSVMPGDRMLLFTSAGLLSEDLESQVDDITAQAVRAQIVINAIDAKGLFYEGPSRSFTEVAVEGILPLPTFIFEQTTRSEKEQADQAAMENFAMATGGLLFRNNNDLDYGFYELGVVPSFSYILSFSADDVRPDGSYHALKVKVDRPNSLLEYRPGYYAPTAAAAAAAQKPQAPPENKLDQAVQSREDLAEIPASASAKPAKSSSGAPALAVTIHIDVRSLPFEQKDDRELERLDLVVALFDAQNNFVVGKHGTFELALKEDSLTRLKATGINGTLNIEAPPGTYRLRAVAQEALTGKTAATSEPVQIQ